ncbi:MAG: caspase family protein [Flavobacteriales bacterium]|nr:caspase family protein [Flavobacteriales bacterium]
MSTSKLILSLLIVIFTVHVKGQDAILELSSKKEFKEQSDNHISSAILSKDGYHVVTGYTRVNSNGGKDIWVAKLNVTGELIWQKTFGGINNDEGTAIVETNSGDYAIVGHSINSNSGYTEGWFLKLNTDGKQIAKSVYSISPYLKINDIKNFEKNNFIICGVREEAGDDDKNLMIMKINTKGVKLWQQEVGTRYFTDEAFCLSITKSNEIIAGGYTTNDNKQQSALLVKVDAYGKILFEEKIGDTGEINCITAMEETPDNKLILAGYTSVESKGEEDVLAIIFDKSKKLISKKSFGKASSDKLYSITPYKGGYLALGSSNSIQENKETLYMVKFDLNLNVVWERTYINKEGSTHGSKLIVNHDGFTVFGSYEKGKVTNALILNYKDNSDDLISQFIEKNPTNTKNRNEIQQEALKNYSIENGISLLENVVVEEFDDVTYRGSGDPLKGLNVSKSLDDLKVGNYYALIIGIDKYSGSWKTLNNAVNDAKAIEALLKSKYKFNHFKSLYNENATRENIIAALEWLLANAKPDDNVFIYYSGHGEFKKELNKGYWVPYGATTLSTTNYISNSDIQTFIKGIKSQHTLLVADACFSGDIFRGNTMSVPFENSPKYFKKVHSLKSRQAMTSGGIEPVMDGGKDGHSVFAYYLLKALKENNSEMMDASQVFGKLKIPVYNNSDQSPDFKPISKSGDEGGQFIFMKK